VVELFDDSKVLQPKNLKIENVYVATTDLNLADVGLDLENTQPKKITIGAKKSGYNSPRL
jgi:hypothetical protein